MLLPFVQFDYAGRLGLADGRYVAREPDRVLIAETFGAPHPAKRRGRRRRAKPAEPPATPETVPVTRITVVRSDPFDDEAAGSKWLDDLAGDSKRRVAEAREALALLNFALEALRDAAEDPLVHTVGVSTALAVRVGFGTGEQLADGNWTEARQLPPPPSPRHLELDPQKEVADRLAGRDSEDEEGTDA